MNVRPVTFYTPGPYADHALALKQSANALGEDVELFRIEGLTSWHHAVCSKPLFILQQLQACQEDGVLWLDADARFRAKPDFSILENIDVAACLFQRNKNAPEEVLTGTLYFANNAHVKSFVEQWCINTRKWRSANQDTPEQHSLKETLNSDETIRFLDLPKSWVYIEPDFQELYPDLTPVISHLQASRTLRV